jgi:hypothetical protein
MSTLAKGVKSYRITACLIAFVIIYAAMQIPAVAGDGLVSDNQFNGVLVKVCG